MNEIDEDPRPKPGKEDQDILIRDYTRLAYWLALRYGKSREWVKDELVSVALLALVRAAREWDPKRGTFGGYVGAVIEFRLMNACADFDAQARRERHTRHDPAGIGCIDPRRDDGDETPPLDLGPDEFAALGSRLPAELRTLLRMIAIERRTVKAIGRELGRDRKWVLRRVAMLAAHAAKYLEELRANDAVASAEEQRNDHDHDPDRRVAPPALRVFPRVCPSGFRRVTPGVPGDALGAAPRRDTAAA